MPASSSQGWIGRNRPPRVQIQYDVEIGDAIRKVELPFVVGVMADLSGKPAEAPAPVADRKFAPIDVDNFSDVMKAIKPRVAFAVENKLTGEGNMAVELTFESMEDFSPASVAKKVPALNELLTARQQLSNLITFMDGKTGAEDVLNKLLSDPALLQAVATAPKGAAPTGSAGESPKA